MHILIANDDGIHAEGIQALAQALHGQGYQISIVAPDHERSAVGHAITMHRPLRVEKVKFMHNPNFFGWAVNGTPSDCVKLAIEAILPEKPDLVISGINKGANLGSDIFYSGTVSAAMEASLLEIPAVAVSLVITDNLQFDVAACFVSGIVPLLIREKLPFSTLLNINVPGIKKEEIKGVAITKLGARRYRNTFQRRVDPRGRSYYWLAGEIIDAEEDEKSDVTAIKNSYISITPVHFELTDHQMIKRMDAWPDFMSWGKDNG